MMASVDTMLLKGLQYRMVGPNRGGRVTTVTGVPSQPRTFYMGVASGGVFRTTDGGQSWEALKLPVEPNSVVYWFATHPAIPDVIAAASLYGYVYVSTDGGESWQKLRKEFGEIRTLAVTPN